jgi:hypothetical protein
VRFLEKPNKTLLNFSQFNYVEVFVLKDACCTQSPKSKASLDAATKAWCSRAAAGVAAMDAKP